MADDKKKTDWTKMNNAIQKRRGDEVMPATAGFGTS
jgi:hypothetical protein